MQLDSVEMAPIACSLTPNLTFHSAGVFFWKSPNIFIRVILDKAKSAQPPIRPGNVLARAFRRVGQVTYGIAWDLRCKALQSSTRNLSEQ
jgi:hypothetical protein